MTAGEAAGRGAQAMVRAGLAEARREAVALVRALTGVDPRLHPERSLSAADAAACAAAMARRARREPFAYVVGRREFWGLELAVAPGVFIPRPETEALVDAALHHLPREGALACDLCTGSGAVALALGSARPSACIDATDIAAQAVAAVGVNARLLGLADRVVPGQGDLFTPLPPVRRGGYDLCTCNPPYVDPAAWVRLPPEVRDWEPPAALVAPEGWRALYRRLAAGALRWLKPGGWLLCEVGAGQADAVGALFRAEGLRAVGARRDLAGIARVVEGRRP